MTDPAQNNSFALVQAISREFRSHLKRNQSADLGEYLERVEQNSRQMLFQNLLHLDVEYRRRRGEAPNSHEYIRRFPAYAGLIRQAFFESTLMTQEPIPGQSKRDSSLGFDTETIDHSSRRRLGDYELVRELGRGGFGVVYEAAHMRRGDRVALKTLPMFESDDATSSRFAQRLHLFRKEFRSLAEINHPNLAGMQTLEFDDSKWFFTMDLIRGEDYLSYVAPLGKLNLERLRSTLPQLIQGIAALHQQGILHRDLKPSNVMVEPSGHLVILDFGLVAELYSFGGATVSVGTQHFAGTPRYAAPEQAAGERTSAIDWYAMGTMLYEALTGEAPFAESGVQLLMVKQNQDAPLLGKRGDIPPDLAELVDQLLQRDPSCRPTEEQLMAEYVTAGSTYLSAGTTWQDSHGSHVPGSLERDHPSSHCAAEDEFLVGRERQLSELQHVFDRFNTNGAPEAVFVRGRSGEGKTSLVDKFLGSVRKQEPALILAGRCYDRESVPFKAIDCLIEPLVRHLRGQLSAEVERALPQDIGLLAHVFPILLRVDSIADLASLTNMGIDNRQLRYRAFSAFRELLQHLGKQRRVILFVDDLQWGDADSAVALFEIFNAPQPPAVLFIGSYRSDEAAESPFLSTWSEQSHSASLQETTVDVQPLDQEQSLLLLASRLAIAPEQLSDQAERLFADTNGNPYFLEQLIEGFDRESGEFQPITLEETIDRKLRRLPLTAKSLLQSLAISGQAAALDEVGEVAEVSTDVFTTITRMCSERLVRLIGSSDQRFIDTYHDKIRETVQGELEDTQRKRLHQRYSDVIKRDVGVSDSDIEALFQQEFQDEQTRQPIRRLFDLAFHLNESGHKNAFVYQLASGEQALASYAAGEALGFFGQAEQQLNGKATSLDAQHKRFATRLALGKARAFLVQKQAELAIGECERALQLTETPRGIACAEYEYASGERFLSNFGASIQHYDNALREIGKPRHKSTIANVLKFVTLTVRVALAESPTSEERAEVEASPQPIPWEAEFEAKLLRDIGLILMEKDIFALACCLARCGQLNLLRNNRLERSMAFLQIAFAWSAMGLLPIGRYMLKRARLEESLTARSTEGGEANKSTLGHLWVRWGGVAYWLMQYRLAQQHFQRSLLPLEQSGQHYEISYGPHMQRHAAFYVESSEKEMQYARHTHRVASEIGSQQQICWGTYDVAVATARAGNQKLASQWMDDSLELLQGERYYMTESIRGASCAFVCLQLSDYQRARAFAKDAWTNALQNWVFTLDVVAFSLPLLVESILGPNWGNGGSAPISADRRQLKRLKLQSIILRPVLSCHRSHLLRVWARYDFSRGKRKAAKRKLERAVKLARSHDFLYPTARAILDLSCVDATRREDLVVEAISLLKKAKSVIPWAERWQLGEQFDPCVVADAPHQ